MQKSRCGATKWQGKKCKNDKIYPWGHDKMFTS